MRDLRDPQLLGETLLSLKPAKDTRPLSRIYDINHRALGRIPAYSDGGLMSSDPAHHHSKTPQGEGDLAS